MPRKPKPVTGLNFAVLPPEAFDSSPRAAVVLTDESAYLARYDDRGERTALYPVTVADVAACFNTFGASTGLLPADCLFWQHTGQGDRLGLWLSPARRTLRFGGHIPALTLPLPGLVFVGRGRSYWLYAATRRPEKGDRLYCAPLPNVHQNGSICTGTVKFPACSAATIRADADLFFESEFNYDLLLGNVAGNGNPANALRALKGAKTFPTRLLVPSITVTQLLGGEHDN
jgi:PRTRC genetic system protein B